MNETLSVVLPVRNAQAVLPRQISLLLEVIGELTPRFEIVVVDDASTDRTEEAAHELSIQYPQVLVARHSSPRGLEESIATGVAATYGDRILVVSTAAKISAGAIRRMLLADPAECHSLEVAGERTQRGLMQRLTRWGRAVEQVHAAPMVGLELFRREDYYDRRIEQTQRPTRIDNVADDAATPTRQPKFLSRLRYLAFGE